MFSLSITSYPSTRQLGSATWQWQDISLQGLPYLLPVRPPYFIAESVSGKDVVDSRTFKAGLLLGIAGSGIIVILDRLFDAWHEIREYREKLSESGQLDT